MLLGILLQVNGRKDGLDFVAESLVVDQAVVRRYRVVGLKSGVLFGGQLNLLAVKDAPELLVRQVSLA